MPDRLPDPDPERTPPRGVLYIEDDITNVTLMERILTLRPSISLTIARTGANGLEHAITDNPELILLDRRLPDMTGDAVLVQLKSSEATSFIAVVMVSGDTDQRSIAAVKSLGATGYLTKPFNINELIAAVDQHCLHNRDPTIP